MVDCPCGYGKDISEEQSACPICGNDVQPLHRIRALPRILYAESSELVRQGKVEDAVERLAAALSLGGASPAVYHALGDAYYSKGLYEQAKHEYERGLNLSPDDPQLRVAQEAAARAQSHAAAIHLQETSKLSILRKALIFVPILTFLAGAATFAIVRTLYVRQPPPIPSYAQLASKITTDLGSDPLLAGSHLDVIAENQQLRLAGEVPSEAHRRLALEIARHKAGDQAQVISGLTVAPAADIAPKRYTVKAGDTLGKLAARFYGDSSMWPKLYDANREKMTAANKLAVNQILMIPR
jgi:nucleoid-associated protein YgaU